MQLYQLNDYEQSTPLTQEHAAYFTLNVQALIKRNNKKLNNYKTSPGDKNEMSP